MGYANPMRVVNGADKQEVHASSSRRRTRCTYELAAKPNDIQFASGHDLDIEWTNTTTDQYIYVKKAWSPDLRRATTPPLPTRSAMQAVRRRGPGQLQRLPCCQVLDRDRAQEDADGTRTADLTFVPKDENIAGHFGDSGYELDEANLRSR